MSDDDTVFVPAYPYEAGPARGVLSPPTVGILLCAARNDAVVRYALANTTAPMAVAGYTSGPVDPEQLNLPQPAELEALLTLPVTTRPDTTAADEQA